MEKTYTLSEAAEILEIPKVGRNLIYQILREMNIVDDYNRPLQKFIDLGFLDVRVPVYSHRTYLFAIPVTVVVGNRGMEFIRRTVEEYLQTHPRPKVSHPNKNFFWIGFEEDYDFWSSD